MATKDIVDRAMLAFGRLDSFGKGLTARVYGVRAAEGVDGMRAAFTQATDAAVLASVDDMEDEAKHLDDN